MRISVLPCLALLWSALPAAPVFAQSALNAPQYTADGELRYPDNLDEWILMGTSLGSDYNDEPFSAEHPGTIGVVQMEPTAYRHFREHGEYADGTMFLLSFFEAAIQSEPQLQGFVQGSRQLQEIHVIDGDRFNEGRAFFVYPTADVTSSARVPDGSECVACHIEHGDFNGTFVQFYPTIREYFAK